MILEELAREMSINREAETKKPFKVSVDVVLKPRRVIICVLTNSFCCGKQAELRWPFEVKLRPNSHVAS